MTVRSEAVLRAIVAKMKLRKEREHRTIVPGSAAVKLHAQLPLRKAGQLVSHTPAGKTPSPVKSARLAGLRYVSDSGPGIRRRRAGKGFVFMGPGGRRIHDARVIQRIRSLVIPPAWTDVWICPSSSGHLQAVGRDARGRKQYRYHPHYRQHRDQTKFEHMIAFGQALPLIRRRINRDLRLPGLPQGKVLAAIVRLLDRTSIRVGNVEYARENHSFGLTTLRSRHVQITRSKLRFHFRGKSGQEHDIQLEDPRLARILKQCHDLPGQELFMYLNDEGRPAKISSEDVNQYIRDIAGQDFTAKDFRTWAGTSLALLELQELGPATSASAAKRNLVAAIKTVAQRLGNRPAACRKYYVHPAVLESYRRGLLAGLSDEPRSRKSTWALRKEELAVMKLLGNGTSSLNKAA
jgi:DNA topoisomerase I